MVAQGLLENKDGLGLEASGIVRRIGSNVVNVKVDDKVLVMGCGLLRSSAIISAEHCLRLPDGLSLEEASTMPVAYASVIYSLLHRAVLDRGDVSHFQVNRFSLQILTKEQSILIHSACGGVGIAAVQLCQSIGAKVRIPRQGRLRGSNNQYLDLCDSRHGRKGSILVGDFRHSKKQHF